MIPSAGSRTRGSIDVTATGSASVAQKIAMSATVQAMRPTEGCSGSSRSSGSSIRGASTTIRCLTICRGCRPA
eukprot:scaffold107568_cov77-Phaeocystis_antarctica.AAC.14